MKLVRYFLGKPTVWQVADLLDPLTWKGWTVKSATAKCVFWWSPVWRFVARLEQ